MMLIETLMTAFTIIGSVNSKGWFIKDRIDIISFSDPDYPELVCYTTRYKRALTFSSSTKSSLSCRRTSIKKRENYTSKENVFAQVKNPFHTKTTVVDRIYDKTNNVMVYISYTKGHNSKNASHSLSVVVLNN